MRHALYTTSSVFSAIFIAVLVLLVLTGLVHAQELPALPAMTATTTPVSTLPTIVAPGNPGKCFSPIKNLGFSVRDSMGAHDVRELQKFLKDNNYLAVDPTGYFGALTKTAVMRFQQDHNVPATGFVGPLTRDAFSKVPCVPGQDQGNYPNANKNLSFKVTTDKSTYSQADDITITIAVTNTSTTTDATLNWSSGCATSYNIGAYDSRTGQVCTQALTSLTLHPGESKSWTMTYSHGTYPLTAGIYQVIGRVNTIGEARTTINIVAQTSPYKITSPNGGEVWHQGSHQTITWTYAYPVFSALGSADISLVPYIPPCQGICPMYMMIIKPYTIATGTPLVNGSLQWVVGSTLDQGRTIPDGKYRMQICVSGSDVCDTSDESFMIVSDSAGIINNTY